jgi:hypothetical protein
MIYVCTVRNQNSSRALRVVLVAQHEEVRVVVPSYSVIVLIVTFF